MKKLIVFAVLSAIAILWWRHSWKSYKIAEESMDAAMARREYREYDTDDDLDWNPDNDLDWPDPEFIPETYIRIVK